MKETNKKTRKNIKESLKSTTLGFTLVELLAVIVILAIILVIAVPKVMSIIEDAKMGTLESTAKMIASGAEKQKVQNTVLGKTEEITCDSVAKINKGDYASCSITFEDNTAKVTIQGSGKFDGFWVCNGTKTDAEAQKESCVEPLQVKHKLFFKGEELTTDKFEVTLVENDGSTRILENGSNERIPDDEAVTITSSNFINDSTNSMENIYEHTFEGATAIQVVFNSTRLMDSLRECYDEEELNSGCWGEECLEACNASNTYIALYNDTGKIWNFYVSDYISSQYRIPGNYVKIAISSDLDLINGEFSATIKPIYKIDAEYTVSPAIAPTTDENFDVTISLINQNLNKKITTKTSHKFSDYIIALNPFEEDIKNEMVEYNEKLYDAGIRYDDVTGASKNKVYFNCEATDGTNVYGSENYNYESSCEKWNIIGIFELEDENGVKAQRVKLVNSSSTFKASWDSSASNVNDGLGINQWGSSGNYNGADLMQLLNGYYIGKENSTCTYCNGSGQETCSQTCTIESLTSENMKPLTSNALSMLKKVKWNTYATDSEEFKTVYLEENGISTQYSSNSENDGVKRTTNWLGFVGLISFSDMIYTDLYTWDGFIATITPKISSNRINSKDYEFSQFWPLNPSDSSYILPSIYLDENIKVISGNGDNEPYILGF